ncbi:NmrA-like family domain-containing protein [Paramyrothecium foliicola]|nr:NmrA-like family domain-containing protein [Paramyrothecium foliicola]
MPKTIVIIGVTGTQGQSVADTFLGLPKWHVRGISRNPSSEAALALAQKGVEIVKGDLDDKESLRVAFKGANVIFSNTDFFVHLFGALGNASISGGKNPKEYAYHREVEQGVNSAEAAASPEVLKTLERFIWSNLADASKWSEGKITTVYHFDSKAEVVRQIHQRFPELASRLSLVQLGHYIQNWTAFPLMAPQRQADGSYLTIRTFKPSTPIEFVDARQDTGPAVKALLELPAGKQVLAVSQQMNFQDWMKLWGEIHGVEAGYKQISVEEFWQGVPEPLAEEIRDSWTFIEQYGHSGPDSDILRPEQVKVPIAMTSMEQIIRNQDWSSVFRE